MSESEGYMTATMQHMKVCDLALTGDVHVDQGCTCAKAARALAEAMVTLDINDPLVRDALAHAVLCDPDGNPIAPAAPDTIASEELSQ